MTALGNADDFGAGDHEDQPQPLAARQNAGAA
jgi:hypothetical protein